MVSSAESNHQLRRVTVQHNGVRMGFNAGSSAKISKSFGEQLVY
jgi:hypothetical protein